MTNEEIIIKLTEVEAREKTGLHHENTSLSCTTLDVLLGLYFRKYQTFCQELDELDM